jgi:polar amino acid transport system substrate-binding protein
LAAPALAETPPGYEFPHFRVIDDQAPPTPADGRPVRLLADADFAPYSFLTASGAPAGLAVELGLAACAAAKLKCDVTLRPFDDLLPALTKGEGDVIVSGPRLDEVILNQASMTRPWFRLMGRFAVQRGNPLQAGDKASLGEKRIAVVKDTVHARWLETYYDNAEIVPFADDAKAAEALRTGNVDVLFGDGLRLIYWLAGDDARDCCRLLEGAYTDFEYFSRNLTFLVRLDRPELRAAFDYGLDMAQKSGTTGKIFNAYVPLNPW